MRMVGGGVVLLVAAVMVVLALARDNGSHSQADSQGFAMPGALTAQGSKAAIGTVIDASSDLDNVATKATVVFLFVPGKNDQPPSAAIKEAVEKIEKQGQPCGLFTLKVGSPEFNKIASQVSVPAIIVMVKGKGSSVISGDITEEKLVQGFVAASRSSGCCCGPGGCCQ